MKSGYVAILGIPNAGKSTLLNTLLGDKIAAVSNKPQTTRKRLTGIHSTEGSQVIFLDTPGIHRSEKLLNRFLLAEISEAVTDADVLCYLVASDQSTPETLLTFFREHRQSHPDKKCLAVLTKVDKVTSWQEKGEEVAKDLDGIRPMPVSAVTGFGLKEFLSEIVKLLPEGPTYYPTDQLTDVHLRDIAAEIIREKATTLTFEEIPYSLTVEIGAFKESPELTRIEALIFVEQDSQKGIVIGKGGEQIKKIGTEARRDLEKLLSTKVFLDLRVKVDKNWTKDPVKLARHGYVIGRLKSVKLKVQSAKQQ